MNTRQNSLQRGGTRVAVILLVILVIVGVGWWWANKDAVKSSVSTNTGYTYKFSDPVTSTTTVEKVVTYRTPSRTVVTQTASPIAAGTRFRDSASGLTLGFPLSWSGYRSYETVGGPNGLQGVKQIHFIAPGESTDAFVVNVFTLEQWNSIKKQENFAYLNTPSIGEGTYIGVNFRYAFSAHVYKSSSVVNTVLSSAVFN